MILTANTQNVEYSKAAPAYAAVEGPAKRVANSQRSFERAMEAKAGTPEGRWRKGAYGRISQRVVW